MDIDEDLNRSLTPSDSSI